MADCASWRVTDDDHASGQIAEADHARFAIILTGVFDLEGEAVEGSNSVLEIQTALGERLLQLAES
jgi:hypothetical protein